MNRFDGKVVLITGASGGIGAAAAQRFAQEGARLALVDLNAEGLEQAAAMLGDSEALQYPMDVSDEAAVENCVNSVLARFGQIDVLFNNAGIIRPTEGIEQQDLSVWQQVMAVNLLGGMLFLKHVSPHLMERRQGAVVNTASVAGIRAGAGDNAYSASKAAVISMTQTAACDLGAYGVRVNAICPGLIETGMTKPVFDYARASGKADKLGSRCELRRYGKPDEIAAVVAFLASDDASFITGQALAVDGGNTASLNLPGMKF